MVEFNGWISIWADNDEDNDTFLESTKAHLNKNYSDFVGNTIKFSANRISFNGVNNHRLKLHFLPIEIIIWVAERSEKSYGLIHVLDDEDQREDYHNNFRVWVLKRGVVSENADIYLSPYFPECEAE